MKIKWKNKKVFAAIITAILLALGVSPVLTDKISDKGADEICKAVECE